MFGLGGRDASSLKPSDAWWPALVRSDRSRVLNDVVFRPSIGPLAAWLITGLVGLVAWLTITYAPGAVERANAVPANRQDGLISASTGFWTIAGVALLALAAGMQPLIERRIETLSVTVFARWLTTTPSWLRWFAHAIVGVMRLLCLAPSIVLSLVDYLFARPIATLAGATLQPFWLRYGALLFWMVASLTAAWHAPPPYGLYAFAIGVAVVVGVVRRWDWVERDRESFFVSRKSDPDEERVGFGEDLRDEALVAIAFLLALIPLGLRQIELAYPGTFSGGDSGDVAVWFGFFGAELAKAVPFVDWSEVFYVSNGSSIEPQAVLGAQIVFGIRAMMDLLMIAGLTQAIQIGSRLAEQKQAFASGKIDILEPFVERNRLRTLGSILGKDETARIVDHAALSVFPAYSAMRLRQIVLGEAPPGQRAVQAMADPVARRGALVLAAKQWGAESARSLIVHMSLRDASDENREFARRVARESDVTGLMAVAYQQAQAMDTWDAESLSRLLLSFPDEVGAFVSRAARSARGELDQMEVIPPGRFLMGSREADAPKTQLPRHEVVIAASFEIGKYPVTFDEYECFCDATGYDRTTDAGWGKGRRPVIYVNWHDAMAYIGWLNAWTGLAFRLPSEAEWEYVCRAGTDTQFCCGDDPACLANYAWSEANSENQTHPVGEKLPNDFRVHDMHGLVWEWCADAWIANYEDAPSDGRVASTGDPSMRVIRGGSWYNAHQLLASASRTKDDITLRDPRNGFRLARSL